jgi:hypothetical protein
MFEEESHINQMEERSGFDGSYNSGHWGADNKGWSDGNSSAQDADLIKTVLNLIGAIICIIIAPLAIAAGCMASVLYYVFFRWLKYRVRFNAIIAAAISLIMSFIFIAHGGFSSITSVVTNIHIDGANQIIHVLTSSYLNLITPLVLLGLVVGPWIGLLIIYMRCVKMRNSPHLVANEGLDPKWMYHFRFRMSPIESLSRKRMINGIRSDTLKPYHRKDLTPLGVEDDPLNPPDDPTKIKNETLICRAIDEVPKHTFITGAAGSGKTVTLKSMMTRDIDAHTTMVMIDCKKDPENAEFLSRRAASAGCHFYHFSADLPYMIQGNPAGPSSYDPLSSGSTSKKVDMLLNTREWDTAAAVYRDQAQSYLSKVFAVIDEANKHDVFSKVPIIDNDHGELWTFTQMLDPNIFNAVIVAMNDIPDASYVRQQASELNALLSSTRRTTEVQAAQHSQGSYLSKMTGLMVSSYGKWLKGADGSGSGNIIDLMKLTSEPGNVILFSLDAAQKGDLGSLMGSMVCTDLANMTEIRKNLGHTNPVSVYIDEFQSLPPECVKSMLQKARSANVGLSLAFQSLDQVSAETGSDSYIKSLLDTCSNFIFHAGSNYDTGLIATKIIGTHMKNKYIVNKRNETKLGALNWTNNRDLQVNSTPSEEWIVDPSDFAKLAMPNEQNGYRSEAIIIKKASSDPIDKGSVGAIAHKTRMIPPDCVLQEFFDPMAQPIDIDKPLNIRVSKGFMNDVRKAAVITDQTPIPQESEHQYEPDSRHPSATDTSTRNHGPQEADHHDTHDQPVVSNAERMRKFRQKRTPVQRPVVSSSRRQEAQPGYKDNHNSMPMPRPIPAEDTSAHRQHQQSVSLPKPPESSTPKVPSDRLSSRRNGLGGHGLTLDDFDD